MAAKKGKSVRAIRRANTLAARKRFQLEKKRSAAAKRGWETRRTNQDGIYDRAVKWLRIYRESGSTDKKAYAYWRQNKRFLYDIMGNLAEDVCYGIAQDAGWDVESSVRFARLS
jgi:predicted N-acyltransferase